MLGSQKLILISGVSGAGEDSVIQGLIDRGLPIERIITTVTREMRKGESQGKPYYFISVSDFKKMIKQNKFVEWAQVYGDYRGCTCEELERAKKSGRIAVWKVDLQGVITIKRKFPDALAIHIKPPSLEVAVERIKKRGKDKPYQIEARKRRIAYYLKLENDKQFDYIVINKEGKLAETVDKVEQIIRKNIG